MAEGIISTKDVHAGTQAVSGMQEVEAIGNAMKIAKKAVDGYAVADLTSNLDEIAKQAEQEALQQGMNQTAAVPAYEGDDPVLAFENRILQLEAQANAARDSGTRARVQAEMQRELRRAQAKYGWLKDELARSASNFMSTSPELTTLGLVDSANQRESYAATTAKAEIERIRDRAYDTGPLGLKMDPVQHQFGTQAFYREYLVRNARLQKRIDLEELEAGAAAAGTVEARNLAQISHEQYTAPHGAFSMGLDNVSSIYQQRAADLLEFNADSSEGAAALASYNLQWNEQVKPALQAQVAQMKAEAQARFVGLWAGKDQTSKHFEAARQEHDAAIAVLETLQAAIQADSPDVADQLKAAQTLRAQSHFAKTPTLQRLIDVEGAFPGALKIFNELGLDKSMSNIINQYGRSEGLAVELQDALFPSLETAIAARNEPDATSARRSIHRRRRANPDSKSGYTQDADNPEGAVGVLMDTQRQWLHYWGPNKPGAIDATSFISTGINYQGQISDMGLQLTTDDLEPVRSVLSSPKMYDVVEQAGGREDILVQAYADELEESWYDDSAGDSRARAQREIAALAQQDVWTLGVGGPLISVLIANTDALETEGKISFTVNDAALHKVIGEDKFKGLGRSQAEATLRRYRQAAKQGADRLAKQVNYFIGQDAFINWANQSTADKNYFEPLLLAGNEDYNLNQILGLGL